MINQVKNSTSYQRQHPILDTLGKLLLNLAIAAMLLGLGFWLALASTMGPTYLPEVMDGVLDMWIRFTMLAIGAIIWLVAPIWFLWSSIRYGYKSYKGIHSTNTPV